MLVFGRSLHPPLGWDGMGGTRGPSAAQDWGDKNEAQNIPPHRHSEGEAVIKSGSAFPEFFQAEFRVRAARDTMRAESLSRDISSGFLRAL